MTLNRLLSVLLNYFWLSYDPRLTAKMLCDQHCFKIHTEVISAVWDSVLELAPWVEDLASEEKIPRTYRNRIHARPGSFNPSETQPKWHPLSKWCGISRNNAKTALINSRAMLEEHQRRTGRVHVVWKDWYFLWGVLPLVNYSIGSRWSTWKEIHFPDLELEKLLQEFRPVPETWFQSDSRAGDGPWSTGPEYYTDPPRCFGKFVPSPGISLIQSYREYYEDKTKTIKGGMRYYYSNPPEWLQGEVWIKV